MKTISVMSMVAVALVLVPCDFATAQELTVNGLKVGVKGRPERIDAKVMQVIDDNQMLVGIEDARNGDGRYSIWVMVKCPTTGITDGTFWRGGQWKDVTGSEVLEVTGTTTYKTATGGTKTVFVVEGAAKRPPSAASKPAKPVLAAAKIGAAAYDDFIDPVREIFIKEWEKEVEAIKRAIKDDEERARKAKTFKDRQHFERLVKEYTERLARVERNDPPYINLDSLKKKR